MKIIVTTTDNIVKYAFSDAEQIQVTEANIAIGDPATEIIGDLNSGNSEVIECVELPKDFKVWKYVYTAGEFTLNLNWINPDAPVIVVPQVVTMKQARLALIQSGYISQVEAAFNAIPDEKEKATALTWWEYSLTVERDNKYVLMMLAVLKLTKEQGDALFVLAGAL